VTRHADGTLFIELHRSEPKFSSKDDGTPVLERTKRAAVPQAPVPAGEAPPGTLLERTRDDRLALLARRYVAGDLTPEDDARLRIATERMRRLLPYVTPADVEAVETMVGEVEALDARLEAIRTRFGIGPKPTR
jgi:hypothetical protein